MEGGGGGRVPLPPVMSAVIGPITTRQLFFLIQHRSLSFERLLARHLPINWASEHLGWAGW